MKKQVLILSLLALVLSSCGKYEEKTRDVGYRGIAKVDHFLAARRMIEEMGWTAFSYGGVPNFPPPAGATLIAPAASLQSEGMLEELDTWLTDGGNLIAYLVVPDERSLPSEIDDDWESMLAYFECEVAAISDLEKSDFTHLDWDAAKTKESQDIKKITLDSVLLVREEPYATNFETTLLLRDLEDEDARHDGILTFDYGEGTLTLLATAKPFSNKNIHQKEHATLLRDLIAMGQGVEVWFVYSTRTSFFGLLWQRGPFAVLALLLTLIILVWWAARGFGPRYTRGTDSNPKLDEHLLASGAFFIKHRADTLIVQEHRKILFRKMARSLNRPLNTPPQDLLDAASKEKLLSGEELAAMSHPLTDKTLLTILRNLQTIDQKL